MSVPLPGWPTLRAELRAMFGLAWPLALTNLSQHAMAMTDALILGRRSTEALAAATLGANLYWAVMALPLGAAFAAAAILARLRGAGGRGWVGRMRRGVQAGFAAALLVLAPGAVLLWQAEPVLLATGQTPALAAGAGLYLRCMVWALIPFSGFLVLRGFLAAMERPGPGLAVALVAILLNALLCWALVFPAGLDLAGAGLATLLANGAMLVGLLGLIARDRRLRRFRLLGRWWRLDRALLAETCRLGLPICITLLLEIGVFAAAALAMGMFGAVAVAAHAVALQLSGLTFMVPLGIAQAATARVGFLAGAGDAAGAVRAGWLAIGLAGLFMLVMAVVLIAGAPVLAAWFLGAAEPEAVAAQTLAARLLVLAGIYQVADGIQAAAAGALRGLKDTRLPLLIGVLGYWCLGMPIGVGLAHGIDFGPRGLWMGLAAGLAVVAGLLIWRWWGLTRGGLALASSLGASRE
jgi:multidrug resistance protein, MATE family